MKKAAQGVARRYAQALLELALERGQAQETRQALAAAVALVGGQPELGALLASPAVALERKQALVSAIWTSADVAEALVARLVSLLVGRGRAELLPAVSAAFVEALNTRNQVVAVCAHSATPLDALQLESLKTALQTKTGKAVELESDVDATLVGGLVLELEGRIYDGSVRAQLAALRQRLIDGGRRA